MSLFHITPAMAEQAGAGAPTASLGGAMALFQSPLTMLIIIFIIFYFLIIRPQQKKQKETQELLRKLAKGDKVLTASGIYGTIISLTDNIVTLQVDDKVKMRVTRSSIAGLTKEE